MKVLEGYVDVAERIRQLREKHPEAVLRPYNPEEPFKIVMIGNREFIIYTAACYRTPDDPMPAIAVAAEPAVGKTNFTRDSEVMNAETSAWGRAIVAALAADTQKIASLEEVRNRQSDEPSNVQPILKPVPKPAIENHPTSNKNIAAPKVYADQPSIAISDKQKGMISKVAREKSLTNDEVLDLIAAVCEREVASITELSKKEATKVIDYLLALVV